MIMLPQIKSFWFLNRHQKVTKNMIFKNLLNLKLTIGKVNDVGQFRWKI